MPLITHHSRGDFLNFFIIIEKLKQLTHVVGTLSHKGIARRALPASGGKDVVGGGGGGESVANGGLTDTQK